MCIIVDKPIEEQIENTGITNLICFKVYWRESSKKPFVTPFRNSKLELRKTCYSEYPLKEYRIKDGRLLGGIHTLQTCQDALKYIMLSGLMALSGIRNKDIEVIIVSGLIPSHTNYIKGFEYEDYVKSYASESFKPILILKTFTSTNKGRMDFYKAIRNIDF